MPKKKPTMSRAGRSLASVATQRSYMGRKSPMGKLMREQNAKHGSGYLGRGMSNGVKIAMRNVATGAAEKNGLAPIKTKAEARKLSTQHAKGLSGSVTKKTPMPSAKKASATAQRKLLGRNSSFGTRLRNAKSSAEKAHIRGMMKAAYKNINHVHVH